MEPITRSSVKDDLVRMGYVMMVIAALNIVDSVVPLGAVAYMTSVLSSTSVVLFIAAASHLMRKIFFPQISLSEMANEAKKSPMGAAMVFCGICMVLSTLIMGNIMLLK